MQQARKKTPKDHCLDHFDIFYKKTFGKEWPSLRLALLSRPKFCALVNNYGDTETTFRRLKSMGCYSIKKQYHDEADEIQASIAENPNSVRKIRRQTINSDIDVYSEVNKIPEEVSPLMTAEMASKRIIQPQEMILHGGGSEVDAASASMYDFVPSRIIKGMEDFAEESDYYEIHERLSCKQGKTDSFPIETRVNELSNFPKYLEAYTFAKGASDMRLEPPEKGLLGTFDYYCMDAASLLPVIALDVQRGDAVLDTCAAPGGKSLVILQVIKVSLEISGTIKVHIISQILC